MIKEDLPVAEMESTSPWKPKYVVLGPGGVKGMYLLGALHRLYSQGRLDEVRGWAGASVGAMIGLLLNIGYTPIQIVTIGADTKLFSDFFSVRLGERMAEMKENSGIISNAKIRKQLEEAFLVKYDSILTLHQLYQRTGVELYITTYDTTDHCTVRLSYKSHPNMSCITAVLLSSNIPLFFYRLNYEGHVYVDGGLTAPLPLGPFDDGQTNILTISIDTRLSINDDDTEFVKLAKYLHCIITSSMSRLKEYAVADSSSRCRHIVIISSTLDTTGSSLTAHDKAVMITIGIKAANKFLNVADDDSAHQLDGMTPYERLERVKQRIVYQHHDTRTLSDIAA